MSTFRPGILLFLGFVAVAGSPAEAMAQRGSGSPNSWQQRLLGAKCNSALADKLKKDMSASIARHVVDPRTTAVNAQVTNVQGAVDVKPARGANAEFSYLCSFRSDQGNRLTNVEYNRKGGIGGGQFDFRAACRRGLEAKLRRDAGAEVANWYGAGEVLAVNPQVTNVQGEINVRQPRGPAARHSYFCSFRTDQNNRLTTVDYRRKNAGGDPGGAQAAMRNQCRQSIQTKVREGGANVASWRGNGEFIRANTQVTNLQGAMMVQQPRGPQREIRYFCSFRTDQNNRLTLSEVRR